MKAGGVKDMILFLGLNTLVVGLWTLDAPYPHWSLGFGRWTLLTHIGRWTPATPEAWLVVGRSFNNPTRRSAGHSAGAPGYYGRKAPSIFPQDIAVYNQVHAGFLAEFFGLFADDFLLEP